MQIDLITIFPSMVEPVLGESILKRARQQGLVQLQVHDLRDYTRDRHRSVDDRPYGGGPGMVMRPEPIVEAVERLRQACGHERSESRCQVLLMSPQGERFSSQLATSLALLNHLTIICGHYEGVDERVKDLVVDRSISIGDYVLTGGELPAMVVIDGLCRYIPGVIGHAEATREESFAEGWLEYPQYTRPPIYRDRAVPDVLLSGDHERIAQWRKVQSVARTLADRPDLAAGNFGAAPPREG